MQRFTYKYVGRDRRAVLEDTAVRGAYEIKEQTHVVRRGWEKQAFLNSVFLIGKGGLCSCVSVLAEWCGWT